MANLDFLLLVHVHVEYHMVLVREVVNLRDIDFGVVEALVLEVFCGERLCPVNHVRRNLTALEQSELRLKVALFRLLHSRVVDYRHTRTCGEIEVQIKLVAHDGVCRHRNLGEQSVAPIALHGIRYLLSGQRNLLSYSESGYTGKHVVLISLHA